MRWELYCRVIDNHGDLGVCWRLARQLGARGEQVRLWIDDARALAWMAPHGAPGVQVLGWSDAAAPDLGDVVVEAFGCEPPAGVRQAMRTRTVPPVWIDLEYLSAEAYVERSHGLPSPQPDGLRRWFFFPGFGPGTGGLLRDAAPTRPFDGRRWLAQRGWGAAAEERVVSVFIYPHLDLAAWLPALAARPTLLLTAPGPATEHLRGRPLPAGLRHIALPWLEQADHGLLLRACDLNAVRGEDSFAQAHWADAPLLWHIYPQHDGVHAAKLEAWLDRWLAGVPAAQAQALRQAQRRWNGLGEGQPEVPDLEPWGEYHRAWRAQLLSHDDLATQLTRFVLAKAGKP